jgi:hypothetical protein
VGIRFSGVKGEYSLRMFETRALRRIIGPKKGELEKTV